MLKTHSVWNNYLFHMNENSKYKRLHDMDEALETLQKLSMPTRLKGDTLFINRIEVRPHEKDPYLLGKRLSQRDSSAKKERDNSMMLEEIEVSNGSSIKKSIRMDNELDRIRDCPNPKPSWPPVVKETTNSSNGNLKSLLMKSDDNKRQDSEEANEGPRTLKDLIKKPPAASSKKSIGKAGTFNLAKELENFDFDQRLLED